MLNTTTVDYDAKAKSLGRSTSGLLLIDFLDAAIFEAGVATATTVFDATTPASQVVLGRIKYSEDTGIGLPGGLNTAHKGWQSSTLADASGVVAGEQLTITYSQNVTSQNFWWVADSIYHPVDFNVDIRVGGVWQSLASVVGHTGDHWALRAATAKTFDAIRITVNKIVPVSANVRLFAFGPVYRLVVNNDDIADFKVTEDIFTESGGAVGNVNSNILDVAIANLNKWFTATSTGSPFYQLLVPNLKVKAYVGIGVATEQFEYLPLGTFYSTDWNSPSTSTEATFVAYDRLRALMELPIPMIPTFKETTLQEMIRKLFVALGLVENTDFTIDPAINVPLLMGWCPGEKVGNCLQSFSEAGNLYFNVSRTDIIRVKPYVQTGTSINTFTDEDMLMATDNPQIYREVCSSVEVEVFSPTREPVTEIGRMESIVLAPGETIRFEKIAFSSSPVAELTNVRVVGVEAVNIQDVDYGASFASLSVHNPSTLERTVTLVLYGKPLKLTSSKLTKSNSSAWGEKVVTVTNNLIQDKAFANSYATTLVNFLGDNFRRFAGVWRIHPAMELGDLIDITDNTNQIVGNDLNLTGVNITYDGGLEGTFTAYKKM
jgi:hypothetical protein